MIGYHSAGNFWSKSIRSRSNDALARDPTSSEPHMLRVGAVTYLNTKPLIEGLRELLGETGCLSLNLPSRLADDLVASRLDVALIPSVECFRHPELEIVSDAVIACRGPVWSVRLLSRVPIREIRSLALDVGSRTSAALVQVLLWERYGLRPATIELGIEQTPEAVDADAVLLIGDRAMHPARGQYTEIWDLGDRWCRWTGLPFVFAMWVARKGSGTTQLASWLEQSRDLGLQKLNEIAHREAPAHGLKPNDLERYFAENLHFQLGARERQGLESFRIKADALGLVSPVHGQLTPSIRHDDSIGFTTRS